jgi:hypothetical protein
MQIQSWKGGCGILQRLITLASRQAFDSTHTMTATFALRLATMKDIPALEQLIPASVFSLQASYYSTAQMQAALGPVFGVDARLIQDGTYFVVEQGGQIVGCGGWSRRRAVFGGDRHRVVEDDTLDPSHDPARIRAFFVRPVGSGAALGK